MWDRYLAEYVATEYRKRSEMQGEMKRPQVESKVRKLEGWNWGGREKSLGQELALARSGRAELRASQDPLTAVRKERDQVLVSRPEKGGEGRTRKIVRLSERSRHASCVGCSATEMAY